MPSEPKTRPTEADVGEFIESIEPAGQRDDARVLVEMMGDVTGEPPVMWGENIIGFGTYEVRYADGRSLDWPALGFSPRKGKTSIYCRDDSAAQAALLEKLGKHSASQACLYVKRLSDVDPDVLREIFVEAYAGLQRARS